MAAIRERLGRAAGRLGERLAADLARFEGTAADEPRRARTAEGRPRGPSRSATPPRCGRPSSPRRPGLDHVPPGTLLVLDEPGDIAEAAAFLWRQADERRGELVDAGELPKDWPSTYLPPRDWKGRLVGSRTLELTWESEPASGRGDGQRAAQLGDVFGWREPTLPLGRAGRLGDAVAAWQEDGARIVLASDQAPRLAEVLAEADHPVAVSGRPGRGAAAGRHRAHRPQPQRRLHAAARTA